MVTIAIALQAAIFILKLSGAMVLPKSMQWQIGLQLTVGYSNLPDEG